MEGLPHEVAQLVWGFLQPKEELSDEVVVPDAAYREEQSAQELSLHEFDLKERMRERRNWLLWHRTDAQRQALRTFASLIRASRRSTVWAAVAAPFLDDVMYQRIPVEVRGREALVLWRLSRLDHREDPTEEATALREHLARNPLLDHFSIGKLGLARARQVVANRHSAFGKCRSKIEQLGNELLRQLIVHMRPGAEDNASGNARALIKFCEGHPRYRTRKPRKGTWPSLARQLLELRSTSDRAEAEEALRDLGFRC